MSEWCKNVHYSICDYIKRLYWMTVPFLQVNAQNHMLRYPIHNNDALYKRTSGQVKATVISAVDPVHTDASLSLS